jgi:hypothetical protein
MLPGAYRDRMASDPHTELRLSRLENDRDALYELVSEIRSIQEDHSRRFDGMDQRFDGLDQRFDGLDQRFDGLDQRFDRMDQRFDRMDQRFDGFGTILAEIVRRLPEPS